MLFTNWCTSILLFDWISPALHYMYTCRLIFVPIIRHIALLPTSSHLESLHFNAMITKPLICISLLDEAGCFCDCVAVRVASDLFFVRIAAPFISMSCLRLVYKHPFQKFPDCIDVIFPTLISATAHGVMDMSVSHERTEIEHLFISEQEPTTLLHSSLH